MQEMKLALREDWKFLIVKLEKIINMQVPY